MSAENDYVLGSGDVELARLEHQHRLWSPWTERLLQRAAFASSGLLLDLGAGPGFTSMALARHAPQAQILGIDASSRFAAQYRQLARQAGHDRLSFQEGDVHQLNLEPGRYDGVFARWLFCFLKSPETVVAQIAQVLKPGGRLAILDYFNYLAVGFRPFSADLARAFPAVHRSFADSGGNLDICDQLPSMLCRHGFAIETLMPINEVSQPGETYWRWFKDFRDSYFSQLVTGGYLSQSELEAFDREMARLERTPGSYFFTPPMMGIVATRL